MPLLPSLAVAAAAYLLGAIPFGFLLVLAFRKEDIRTTGSGNIGATNVVRSGAKGLGALTFLLDALKGYLAVAVAASIADWTAPRLFAAVPSPADAQAIAAAFAILGHMYPVWLRFKGGKGVATFLGIALALYWPCGVAFAVIWLLAFFLTRHSSVGGMTAAIATPVSAALISPDRSDLTLTFLLLALIVLWKHRANVERLLDGTEPRFGSKS